MTSSLTIKSPLYIDSKIRFAVLQTTGPLRMTPYTLRGQRAAVLRTDHETVIDGTLDLRHTTVNVLGDDPAGWPQAVRSDGFTYTTIVSPLSATERLAPAGSRSRWLSSSAIAARPPARSDREGT